MVDEYLKEDQELFNFLINIVKSDKVSHAYLIEENNQDGFSFAKNLAKIFLCSNQNNYQKDCQVCNLCNMIDENNYPELLIIEPDGINIKKEQLLELQEKFSTKPIYGKSHVCIIRSANCFNNSSANSILKFLEEPESPVIIILLCSNRHQVIDTIVSRCQIITMKPLNQLGIRNFSSEIDDKISEIIEIIKDFELISNNVVVKYDIYKYKDNIKEFLNIWLYFYLNILDAKNHNCNFGVDSYNEKINYVCSRLSINDIIKRIDVILSFINHCEYNVNKDLYLDNFFISFEKGECLND